MNADPNSLAGQYIASLRNIDPNRYVSMAASDVQSSYQNVIGQIMRDLGRRGVDASSGRAMSLQQRLNDAMAAAQDAANKKNQYQLD